MASTEGVFRSSTRRRRPSLALHVAGAGLLFVSAGMIVAALVDWGAGGPEVGSLLLSSGIVASGGTVLWSGTRIPDRSSALSTFGAVAATWIIVSAGGAVPYLLAGTFPTFDSALFESVSGFSGTGSTVLADIEAQPRGILFWRQLTQWFGGTGMVVLAVAVLPFLGVGGMELLRAEAPGPTADRLAPRVSGTAMRLWAVYGGFTVLSVVVLLIVGMSPFDAFSHAFTVVSTGGLSPKNVSIAAFDSVAVEVSLTILMLIGGTSFTLHWRFLTGDRRAHVMSSMFRFYATIFVTFSCGVGALLMWKDGFGFGQAAHDATFNVATLLTSTGYGTANFVLWNPGAQLLLFCLMITGGMAGSTAGGMKLIRIRGLFGHAAREVQRVRHPRAVIPVTLGGEPIPERIAQRIVGFALLFFAILGLGTLVLSFLGAGLLEAAGAATGSMSNMGPTLGEAGPASNFLYFSRPARVVIMVLMLAGRLEIYPILFGIAALTSPLRTQARVAQSEEARSVVADQRDDRVRSDEGARETDRSSGASARKPTR